MQIKAFAIACMVAAGCGDDGGAAVDARPGDSSIDTTIADAPIDSSIDSPGGGPLTVTGAITTSGSANPVFVAWQVSSGSPDYLWKFGEGTSTATTFMVTMGSDPPAQAINSYGIAIGIVLMLPDGVVLPPDGIIDESQFDPIGATTRHAIIFKTPTASTPGLWPETFPTGYTCGACVDQSSGFDTFTATACDNVQMVRNPTSFCNWT